MSCKWMHFANIFVILFLWLAPTFADDDIDKSKRWEDGKDFVRETLKNFNQGIAEGVAKSLEKGEVQEKEKAKAYMRGLGFENTAQESMLRAPDRLEGIRVDDPFGVYYIRLDKLISYPDRSDIKPEDLLEPTNGVIYPIVVQDPVKGEQVQSSVTLLDKGGMKSEKQDLPPWELLEMGSSEEVKLFAEARDKIISEKSEKEIHPFVIFIPAMSQVLLGFKDSNTFRVRILEPYVSGKEKSDSADFRSADEVFKELAEKAKKTNYDLPPRG